MGTVRLIVAGTLLPGCFFFDEVNEAPVAAIRETNVGPIHVDTIVRVSADGSRDPDGQPLRYAWSAWSCAAGGACDSIRTGTGEAFELQVPDHDPVRIDLVATDGGGASHTTSLELVPQNRAPEAELDVDGPENAGGGFTVGRALDVRGQATDLDGDEMTYAFTVFPPAASTTYGWDEVTPAHFRLTPDVTGMWEVRLVATDLLGLPSSEATITFRVDEDQPPCIGATTPAATAGRLILERDEPPRRFAVESVIDDLDPWPVAPGASDEIGGARFRWLAGAPAALEVADGLSLPEYWLDASARAPGEVLQLRVEVGDRVVRELPCDDTTAICPTDGCPRRITWEVEIR